MRFIILFELLILHSFISESFQLSLRSHIADISVHQAIPDKSQSNNNHFQIETQSEIKADSDSDLEISQDGLKPEDNNNSELEGVDEDENENEIFADTDTGKEDQTEYINTSSDEKANDSAILPAEQKQDEANVTSSKDDESDYSMLEEIEDILTEEDEDENEGRSEAGEGGDEEQVE